MCANPARSQLISKNIYFSLSPFAPENLIPRDGIWCDRLEISGIRAACLKKNQNAPRPSEHPPVRGEKMSKRLGGIKGCKYKTS